MIGLMSMFNLNAAQHFVTNVTELNTALNDYIAGDEIILAEGVYGVNGTKTITKSVTIKANANATSKPVLSQIMFSITGAASLTLDGLEMFWDIETAATPTSSRYFISATTAVIIPHIKLLNCNIHGYGRSLLRSDGGSAAQINELLVENTIIHDMGRESNGYSIFAAKSAKITKATFLNSTIYNSKNGFWYSEVTAWPIEFTIENSTIIKNTAAGSKLLINTNANPNSVYRVKNSIISDSYDATTNNMVLKLNSNGTTILAHVENSILGNHFPATKITGSLSTNTEVAVSSLSYDYGQMTIQTVPATITGMGDPRWTLNPVVSAPATLTTSVFPANAGTIAASPVKNPYAQGDEITLTATRGFGFEFKEWKNVGTGQTLSTANPYTFNIDADIEVQAIFDPITTYTYTVDVQGSAWGRVQLTPAPVDGKYEAGTVVNMTVVPNAVTNFLNWEDNTTELTRIVVVNENKSFTATFDERPFIVGWDFKVQEPRSGRSGDFYAESANMGSISLHEPNGNAVNWLANAGSFTPSYPCVRIWTAGASFATTRRYFQASFSTEGYNNVNIKSMVSGNYQVYSVQKMQYSLNGTDFTDLASADITTAYNSGWVNLDAILPTAAENQSRVYIRWIADVTSTILGNSVDNDGMALTNIYVYADKLPVVDNDAPVLLSTVPANNANNASANGSITLTFDERVKLGTGACTLNGVTLTPSFGSKTVTFAYSKLAYNTDYTFVVPAGALTDMAGNPFAGTSIQFRTMNRPQPLAKTFDFVVAQDGSGDGTTIQSAFSAVPVNNATPFLIFIKNGVYAEYASLPSNKPNVHIIGQSRDNVIITGSRFSGLVEGGVTYSTSTCQTLELMANNVYMENVTVRNTAGVSAGQAVALKTYGDRCTFNNIKLTGYQDTHLTGSGRQWYLNSDIHGTVDYIFGGGDVFFETCLLYNEARSGGNVIVAPNTGGSLQWGYVFSSCTIDGDAATQNNNYLLGRPWQNSPRAVFLNTRMNILPAAQGWTNMSVAPALFAEYNSMTASGQAVDVSNRRSSFTTSGGVTTTGHQTVLTDVQAAQYTRSNVLSGNDSWDPTPLVEKTANPTNVRKATSAISWDVVDYAISYIVIKNNVAVHFTTSATYTDAQFDNMAEYKVIAVAESGTLSEAVLATDITSSENMEYSAKTYAYFSNNDIVVENLSSNAKVTAFALNGVRIGAYTANSNRLVISNAQNCILQIVDNDKTTRLKMIR